MLNKNTNPSSTNFKDINSKEIEEAYYFCYNILVKVSRTFAISIYRLNKKLKWAVLIAYLLCRIVDTIEDDNQLTAKNKKQII